ncbi:hypothetical protein AB6V29_14540 [Microbacterium sp. 20-116]|uniref:hypothetical protein n=1 Tax=Microbacterium sp. 20-116 TaxID=3239883 RepID=UPI0034E282CA
MEFFAAFDGPAWTTFGISLAALGVSGWALWRARTPQPHWEFVSAGKELVGNPDYWDSYAQVFRAHYVKWTANVRQDGPGTAESVLLSRRDPSGGWSEERELQALSVGRGGKFGIILCEDAKVPGEYVIRIRYRCLPNTRKLRTWEHTLTLD